MRVRLPLALLGVTLLSYGLWIPWFGLFGNDVPYLWYYHLLGPWGPGVFASIDRPASALFYALVTALFGETVWLYHALLLILRWGSGLLLYWVLNLVLPEQKRATTIAALLFVVYPGFGQNPVALEFILHFAVLNLFLASLGWSILAVLRSGRAALYAALATLGAAGLFWLEYFIGLEVLRLLFLLLVLRRVGWNVRRFFFAWLPPTLVVVAFVVWRVAIFSFPTYRPVLLESLHADPVSALVQFGWSVLQDGWTAVGGAWGKVFHLPVGPRSTMLWLALVIGGAVLALLAPRALPERQNKTGELMTLTGIAAIIAGGSIFWLTGIPVTVTFPWDRSTLSFMLGVSLLLAGLLDMAIVPRYQLVVTALLVGLAVGYHFQNAREYRGEWDKLRDFAWQLTWRAPALEPGTLLLFDAIPLNRYSDNDLTALVNWIYAPELRGAQIPYKMLDLTLRLDGKWAAMEGLEADLPLEITHRGLTFQSTTTHVLALHIAPPNCLVIATPEDVLLPGLPGYLPDAAVLTQIDRVRLEGSARPPEAFGPEPERGWCYYYQKASLARQSQDWSSAAAFGNEADSLNLRWSAPAELLPFIEAYAMTGDWERARQWNEEASQQEELRPVLCALWSRAAENLPDPTQAQNIAMEAGCQP